MRTRAAAVAVVLMLGCGSGTGADVVEPTGNGRDGDGAGVVEGADTEEGMGAGGEADAGDEASEGVESGDGGDAEPGDEVAGTEMLAGEKAGSAAMIAGARTHHEKCLGLLSEHNETGDAATAEEGIAECETAAEMYREILERWPELEVAYELTFYMADCLYWSGDFAAAQEAFEAVRDWEGEDMYREDAAHGVEEMIFLQEEAGEQGK